MNSREMELCPADQQYSPPPGTYDKPYIYVYNYEQAVGAPAADPRAGLNFNDLQVPLKGDSEFVLRKIWHYMPTPTTGILPYTPPGNRISSVATFQNNIGISPEMIFPPGGTLAFDVVNWSSNDIPCGPNGEPHIYHAQVLFQGVRRFRSEAPGRLYPRSSTYRYREVPFTYRYDLSVTWPYLLFQGGVIQYNNLIKEADRLNYVVEVADYDFELLYVSCALTQGAGAPDTIVEGANDNFKLLLYDPDNVAVFSDFIYMDAANFHTWPPNAAGTLGTNTTQAAFPVPGIVYPQGSQIRFDVRSMLFDTNTDGIPDIDTPAVRPFILQFGGIRRVRC